MTTDPSKPTDPPPTDADQLGRIEGLLQHLCDEMIEITVRLHQIEHRLDLGDEAGGRADDDLPVIARLWMACRAVRSEQFSIRYGSFDAATAAARKLAAETGAQFHVLETVATARPTDDTEETLL